MPTAEARRGRIGHLYELLAGDDAVEEFLDDLAQMALERVDAKISCGVSAYKEGGTVTIVTSDDVTAELEAVQDATGEGPRAEAIAAGRTVYVMDAGTLDKWPAWRALAVAHGMCQSLSLPLIARDETLGALTLYSTSRTPFSAQDRRAAELFAGHATGALMIAIRLAEMAELTGHLEMALESRAVIDQAKGIIMAERHCTPDEAFVVLRNVSQNQNVRLRHLAAQLVASVSGQEQEPQGVR